MFRQLGPTEILVILGIVVLLFGGKKLPELARGSGRALRIFKTEVKGLDDDDEQTPAELEQTRIEQTRQDSVETADSKPEQQS